MVENPVGSGGGIAAALVATSSADGYQLLVTDNSFLSTNPYLYKQLAHNPKDFITVAQIATAPLFLALHPSVPATSMND